MQHIQTVVITPDLCVVRWEAKSIAKAPSLASILVCNRLVLMLLQTGSTDTERF